jgi:DNA polymerase sigma
VRIDITFITDESEPAKLRSSNLSSIDFAKNALIHHPEIRPILYILKRYLNSKKLNTCFTGKYSLLYLGGLSSHCLLLIVLAYLKFQRTNFLYNNNMNNFNLGRILIEILDFYGKIFNFHNSIIDVTKPQ